MTTNDSCSDSDVSDSSLTDEDDDEADIEKMDSFIAQIEAEEKKASSVRFKGNESLFQGYFSETLSNDFTTSRLVTRGSVPSLDVNVDLCQYEDSRPIMSSRTTIQTPHSSSEKLSHKQEINRTIGSRFESNCVPGSRMPLANTETNSLINEGVNSSSLSVSDHSVQRLILSLANSTPPNVTPVTEPTSSAIPKSKTRHTKDFVLNNLLNLNHVIHCKLVQLENEILKRLEFTQIYLKTLNDETFKERECSMKYAELWFKVRFFCQMSLKAPFLKDKLHFPAPFNRDVFLKRFKDEYTGLCDKKPSWHKKHIAKLKEAIKMSEIEGIIEEKKQEQSSLLRQLKCNPSVNKKRKLIEVKLKRLVIPDIESFSNETLESLVGKRKRDHDWLKISATDLNGLYGPDECKMYWENLINPLINKKDWTLNEDERLLTLCTKYREQDWDSVAQALNTGRSSIHCAQRFKHLSKVNSASRNTFFTKEEDHNLKKVVKETLAGKKINWNLVAQHFPKRTKQQLYKRWHFSLNPQLKTYKFSHQEDLLLLALVRKYGKNFRFLSTFFPGRLTHQLQRRYQLLTSDVVRSRWTQEDDDLLYRLSVTYKEKNWLEISKHFYKRNAHQCRNRYRVVKRHLVEQFNKTGVQDLSELHIKTRDKSKEAKKFKMFSEKISKAVLKLKEGDILTHLKQLKKHNEHQSCSTKTFKTRKRQMGRPKKVDENGVYKENFDSFKEYFSLRYKHRGGRRRTTVTPVEVKTFAENLWLVLGSLGANLTKLPQSESHILSNKSLDLVSRHSLAYLKENCMLFPSASMDASASKTYNSNVGNVGCEVWGPMKGLTTCNNTDILGATSTPLACTTVSTTLQQGPKANMEPYCISLLEEVNRKQDNRREDVGSDRLALDQKSLGFSDEPIHVMPVLKTYHKRKSRPVMENNKSPKQIKLDLGNTNYDEDINSVDSTASSSCIDLNERSVLIDLEVPVVTASIDAMETCPTILSSEVIPLQGNLNVKQNTGTTLNSMSTFSVLTNENISHKSVLRNYGRDVTSVGQDSNESNKLHSLLCNSTAPKSECKNKYGQALTKNSLSRKTFHSHKGTLDSVSSQEMATTSHLCQNSNVPLTEQQIVNDGRPISRMGKTSGNKCICSKLRNNLLCQHFPPSYSLLVGFRTLLKSQKLLKQAITPSSRCVYNIPSIDEIATQNLSENDVRSSPLFSVTPRGEVSSTTLPLKAEYQNVEKKITIPQNIPGEDLWQQRFESLFWFSAIMAVKPCKGAPVLQRQNYINPFIGLVPDLEESDDELDGDPNSNPTSHNGRAGEDDCSSTSEIRLLLEAIEKDCEEVQVVDPAVPSTSLKPSRQPKKAYYRGTKRTRRKKHVVTEPPRTYIPSGKFKTVPDSYGRTSMRLAALKNKKEDNTGQEVVNLS